MTWATMERFALTPLSFVFEGTCVAHEVAVLRAPYLPGQLLSRPHPYFGWRDWRVSLVRFEAAADFAPGIEIRANQYMAYEFWLAVFVDWRPQDVQSFFWRLAGQDPSLSGVSTALETADVAPDSLQGHFLRIGLERGRHIVPGLDGPHDNATLQRSESNGCVEIPVMQDDPALDGRIPAMAVNSISLRVYEDLNLHVHSVSLRFSRPGGPESRVVIEGVDQGGPNATMQRETFVDQEIADLDFEFPESLDPSPSRYWYEPLSVDITMINASLDPDSAPILWRLETRITTAAGPER